MRAVFTKQHSAGKLRMIVAVHVVDDMLLCGKTIEPDSGLFRNAAERRRSSQCTT